MTIEDVVKTGTTFIENYRAMELEDNQFGEQFINEAVSPDTLAERVSGVWRNKQNNFGDFFLNIRYSARGDIIEAWGIPVPDLDSYKEQEREKYPGNDWDDGLTYATEPPEMIAWLSGLIMYFRDNNLDNPSYVKLQKQHRGDKIGNSSNWADYLLSGRASWLTIFDIYQVVIRFYKIRY